MWRRHGPSGPPGAPGTPGPPGAGAVTAGAGLTGGGNPPTTLNVAAADGTIIIAADSIRVGTVPVAQVSGGASTQGMFFSYVDFITQNGVFDAPAGNFTTGIGFQVTQSSIITGVRFYWAGIAARTIKCSLWNPAGTNIATVDVATNGVGMYTGTFGAPQTIAPAPAPGQGPAGNWKTSIYEKSGTVYTRFNGSVAQLPLVPWLLGPSLFLTQTGFFVAGDANPTGTSAEKYTAQPIFG